MHAFQPKRNMDLHFISFLLVQRVFSAFFNEGIRSLMSGVLTTEGQQHADA